MMNKKLLAFAASLVFAGSALAGDAAAGKALAQSCAACHGADGNSAAPSFPKLAGQNEKYLIKQMRDIQSGARPVPAMTGQLDGKPAEDIANIAAYFASQSISGGQADPELASLGEKIYRGGISERGVAACSACHSPTGKGNPGAGYPALAGQHAQYTSAQLQAFRAAQDGDPNGRMNDGDSKIMRTTAFGLSDREIEAVSSYIQGLY